jgi:hypothetical protein
MKVTSGRMEEEKRMTVKDLIVQLQYLDPDALVVIRESVGGEWWYWNAARATIGMDVRVRSVNRPDNAQGPFRVVYLTLDKKEN